MRRTRLILGLMGLPVAIAAFCLGVYVAGREAEPVAQAEPLPVLYPAPSFSMTDSRNQTFSTEALDGKIWVAKFFFTSCAGPCPVMSARFSELATRFSDGGEVRFVSMSVDPDTDTPERLAAYAEKYGADTSRWHFLTAPKEEIDKVGTEGFKLGSAGEPIFHSTRFVLVDGQGRIRGYYDGMAGEEVAALTAAIEALREESKR